MARKPNYDFERREREKARAAKTEERAKAKAERKREAVTPEPGVSAPDQCNADEIAQWNSAAGERWAALWERIDELFAPLTAAAFAASAHGSRVVDLGNRTWGAIRRLTPTEWASVVIAELLEIISLEGRAQNTVPDVLCLGP